MFTFVKKKRTYLREELVLILAVMLLIVQTKLTFDLIFSFDSARAES